MRPSHVLRPALLRRFLPAALALAAACGGGDGGTSAAPRPTVNELNPASVVRWQDDFDLTVTGSGFVQGSVVRWNGSSRPTLYLSPSQVAAAITTDDLQEAGSVQVSVMNPRDGGESNAVTLVVRNPLPEAVFTNPQNVLAGTGAFTLEVFGEAFVPGAVVRWNGSDRPTTFLDPGRLTVQIPGSDVSVAGTAQLAVFNPAPGGGTSNALAFTVRMRPNPIPVANALSPAMVMAEQGGTFTITGTNLLATSTVLVRSPATLVEVRPAATLVSPTELRFSLEPGHRLTGMAQVQVLNPQPGGGGSALLPLEVRNPAPTLSSLSPAEAPTGADSLVLRVTGTGIVASTMLRVDDQLRVTRRVSATEVETTLPRHDLTVARAVKVELWNPAPGGGASPPLTLRLVNTPVPAPARSR